MLRQTGLHFVDKKEISVDYLLLTDEKQNSYDDKSLANYLDNFVDEYNFDKNNYRKVQ